MCRQSMFLNTSQPGIEHYTNTKIIIEFEWKQTEESEEGDPV